MSTLGTCSFPDCDKTPKRRGLCWGHDSQRRKGTLLRKLGKGGPGEQPMEVLFLRHVDKNGPIVRPGLTPCWTWTGSIDSGGYGTFGFKRKTLGAHRVSWLIHQGTLVPEALDVCHVCDNRRCVNPDHLFRGTRSENVLDAFTKGRISRVGAANPRAKLTPSQVVAIRAQLAVGHSKSGLAAEYGVTATAIRWIETRRAWRSVA